MLLDATEQKISTPVCICIHTQTHTPLSIDVLFTYTIIPKDQFYLEESLIGVNSPIKSREK